MCHRGERYSTGHAVSGAATAAYGDRQEEACGEHSAGGTGVSHHSAHLTLRTLCANSAAIKKRDRGESACPPSVIPYGFWAH